MDKKKNFAIVIAMILLVTTTSLSIALSSLIPSTQNPDFAPGVLIVKFRDVKVAANNEKDYATCGIQAVNVLNQRFGVEKMEKVFPTVSKKPRNSQLYYSLGMNRYFKFSLPKDADVLSVVEEYKKLPQVEDAFPDYIGYAAAVPDDEFFDLQWGLHNTGQTGGKVDADIDAPEGWNIEKGLENITIAILDSGVDWDHPDLDDKIWMNNAEVNGITGVDDDNNGFIDDYRGWDFVTKDPEDVYPGEDPGPEDNDPMDFHGHGTHCAGIAAAETDNGIGIAGVAWNPKIMAVRVGYKHKDGGGSSRLSDFANGIQYAADNGANVILMSYLYGNEIPLAKVQIDYAYGLNCVLVAPAGNTGTDWIGYPAGYYEVIAVAATLDDDTRRPTSNYGEKLEVLAPGTDIYSTVFDDTYTYKTGTCMAAPQVAGLAALLFSQGHTTNTQVREIIQKSADDQIGPPEEDTPGWDQYYGWGRINVYKALTFPVAVFNYSPDSPIVNEPIAFNASSSYDPNGIITSYEWNFDDGNITTVTNPITNHTYVETGDYNVSLTLTDNDGLSSTTQKLVSVSSIGVPIANFEYNPEIPRIMGPVTFNATASYDPDGTIISYKWDFDDGNITTTSLAVTIHFFEEPGDYNVFLTVTDNDGLNDTYSDIITVRLTDANDDGIINVYDLGLLGKAWLTTVEHPDYNAAVDFNSDGKIDYDDHHLLQMSWWYFQSLLYGS